MRFTSFGGSDEHDQPSEDELLRRSRRMSPPENELPASVPFTVTLGRNDDVAVALVGSHVYTTGFTVDLAVRLRTSPRGSMHHRLFEMISGHGPEAVSGEERLLLGLEYADARTATNLSGFGWHDSERPGADDELVMAPTGGGGGGRTFDQTYWISPVPPPGTVTFVCAWPAFGLPETTAAVDGAALAAAAGRAVVLWPPSPPYEPEEEVPEPPDVPDGWFSRTLGRKPG